MEDTAKLKTIWENYWQEKNEHNKTNIEQYYSSYGGRNVCLALERLLPKDLTGKKILDVGCGEGLYFKFLEKKGASSLFGLDDNKKILEICKQANPKVTTIIGDINKGLPFDNNYFDIVICFGLIEHFKEPKAVLSELLRVLRSNGLIVLEMPNRLNLGTFLKYRRFSVRTKINWVQWWGPLKFINFVRRDKKIKYKNFASAILFAYKTAIYSYLARRFLEKILGIETDIALNFIDNLESKFPLKYFGHAMFVSLSKI